MCRTIAPAPAWSPREIIHRLDRWVVRMVLLFQWRGNNHLVEERIRVFEATEDDSSWQLLHAAQSIRDPKMKADLFLQSMEEAHHAEVFRGLYQESSGRKLKKMNVARNPIFDPQAPWKLFAYCAVGESAAASRFRHIAEALPAGSFKRSLEKILEEEEGHIELAEDLVSLTGQDQRLVNREIRAIRARRAWEAWLRAGRTITQAVSRGLLSLTYFAIGWWLKPRAV